MTKTTDIQRKHLRSLALRYLTAIAFGNLLWETVQLPLYTIWTSGTRGELVFSVIHCTAGDVMIAAACLGISALLIGRDAERVAAIAIPMGIAYTMFSEWLNVDIRGTWAYAPAMPILPIFGTGLAPLAQWVLVPVLSFIWVRRAGRDLRRPWQ